MTDSIKKLLELKHKGLEAQLRVCYGHYCIPEGWSEVILAAIADLEGLAKPTHCHVKTGGNYTKVGEGRIQTTAPLSDLDEVVIYRAEHDGSLWARRKTEFEDGRFALLAAVERNHEREAL